MIKNLFQKLLLKSGKSYQIDKDIPNSFFLRLLFKRFLMLIRGIFFFQKKCFVGSGCKFYNKKNIFLGENITIENNCLVDGYAKEKIIIANGSRLGAYSVVSSTSHPSKYGVGLTIGTNSAIGRFSEFGAAGGIEIGDDVIMGSYISFHSENHIFEDNSMLIREQGVISKGIKIGNNVWVGAKVTFLDGTKIGNNCVVAAGAVVKGDFPDNVLIGGIPARILKEI